MLVLAGSIQAQSTYVAQNPSGKSISILTDGSGAIKISGTAQTAVFSTALISSTTTTSGTIAAGAKTVSIIVRSGTMNVVATGTTSYTSADGQVNITAPTGYALPAINYAIPTSGTAVLNTLQ